MRLYDNKTGRDVQTLLTGIVFGILGCVLLYGAFGLCLVRIHAERIASKMDLFLLHGMAVVVRPEDPHLQSLAHQLGSALLFGIFLGPWMALVTAVYSLIPWLRGSWNKTPDLWFAALLVPVYLYFMYSRETPLFSLSVGLLTPFFFWIPWILGVRWTSGKKRHPLRLAILALLFLLPLHSLKGMSLPSMRDAMIESSVGNWLSDFYYDHTLLSAHVIKPVRYQTQKVIALSEDVALSGRLPAGSLWIRTAEPCALRGPSLVVSSRELNCPSFVVSDAESEHPALELLREASEPLDKNRAMRRGIRWCLRVGCWVVFLLLALWLTTLVDDLYGRHRGIPLLLVLFSLLLAARGLYVDWLLLDLKADPNKKVRAYVLSDSPEKRYLVLIHYPNHLLKDQLLSLSKDPSPRVRHAAFLAIGPRIDTDFLGALEDGLADPRQIVRTKVCHALGEIGNEEAIEILDEAIATDPSWYVRFYAYKARCKAKPIFKMVNGPTGSAVPSSP
jgi:hypothetical protein